MGRNITVGLDIGTYQIKVIAAENSSSDEKNFPKIVGMGYASSRGLRHGYILNQADAVKSISSALSQAEKTAGMKIKRASLSVGGIGLSGAVSSGTIVISRADNEITEMDVKKAIETSKAEIPASLSVNRKILHTIPIQFKVDGKPAWGRPEGLKGMKLEARVLFIMCMEHHLSDLIETVEESGLEVEEVVASPIAASLVTLTKAQKVAGCVLANIGSETVSIIVYENSLPISLEVFPIGSNDITNDIALGLRVPLEEAEEIKRGSIVGTSFPRKKLEEIIGARLSDIFDLIEAHLKKLGRSGLLPAGIVITGGGSGIETIEDMARGALKLPSRIGGISLGDANKGQIRDASWSVAYGLCILARDGEEGAILGIRETGKRKNNVLEQAKGFFKQFLP